ncbi:MAG TPA: orotidine-5'-phosphate decarboxylase [Bryobacteraceae bacterium]|nr:orotidine-5'-phosphate decarboxylase [Bryobacteraceae bacterium]
MKDNPVIVALDVESATQAREIVGRLGDAASFYKVGLELYASACMDFVRELKSAGHRVFLDLKLYDIGETVRRAVAQIARSGVDFLTVHGMGQVMDAAVAGRGDAPLKLLAVTVLTSVDDADLRADGYSRTVSEIVDMRARKAMDAGIDGLICSPLDVRRVRAIAPRAILVTPGVRSPGASAQDQKRVATPAEAITAGADYLVVGRQITRAADPRSEMRRILTEIEPRA